MIIILLKWRLTIRRSHLLKLACDVGILLRSVGMLSGSSLSKQLLRWRLVIFRESVCDECDLLFERQTVRELSGGQAVCAIKERPFAASQLSFDVQEVPTPRKTKGDDCYGNYRSIRGEMFLEIGGLSIGNGVLSVSVLLSVSVSNR